MSRKDARAFFWNEKFLYGLPRALTEKVQESLRERNNVTIPYEDLTYGDLISEVRKEGLKLCTQLKLQYQVKKDLKASRKDLGSFCAQYGIQMPIPPSQIFKKPKPYREIPYKNKNSKNLRSLNKKKMITNKNFIIKNIKKKLDVSSVARKVI